MSGLLFSWANEICSADNEERALVIGLMNDLAYVVQAIGSSGPGSRERSTGKLTIACHAVPNFTWKQTNYPKASIGLYYSTGLSLTFCASRLPVKVLLGRSPPTHTDATIAQTQSSGSS